MPNTRIVRLGRGSFPASIRLFRASAALIIAATPVCALPSGQFPGDLELDVKEMEVSPGVRRMPAVVEEEAPFEH